ncbi:hypothetical protein [Plastoroseomonas hellenica]|uniref:hypothetical protein n=1 Tax=Plastoroseomonas hellenica TaxID=2687306 RepID=UPI001BA9FA4A|nr:hypothetical protein [Plastoroseomonas hellenica]MBR0645337.1 hypothetical protein [Plastoroseomonas hellenica]
MATLPCADDALVRLLNQQGYQPLLSPRTGTEPPEIYLYDNDALRRWGRLSSAVPAGSLPAELNGGELQSIRHQETSRKGASAAGSFLKDALKCIGVDSAPKLDLSFTEGHALSFSFSGVTWRGLDPAEIGAALQKGFDPGAMPPEQVRLGMVHIAYEYAYAEKLMMTVEDRTGGKFQLQALKLDGFIDLGGKAQFEAVSRTTLSFSGKRKAAAAFACKIGQVKRQQGAWRFFAKEVLGQGATGHEAEAEPYLLRKGAVLIVEDGGGPD